jgi:hypothetical protein
MMSDGGAIELPDPWNDAAPLDEAEPSLDRANPPGADRELKRALAAAVSPILAVMRDRKSKERPPAAGTSAGII